MSVNVNGVRTKLIAVRVLLVTLSLVVASGLGFEIQRIAAAQQSQLPSPADLSRTFTGLAKQIKPAVVNVEVVEKARRSSTMRLPDGFPDFGFGQPRRQQGTGSGVIISSDGYILTNNHVAGDAEQITVKLADGREFKARRVGTDPETDLAVIKIDANNLAFAKLGDSDKLEQGEWVIALGSPFGLQQTMTAGIVSAIGRDLGTRGGSQYTDFIQTDASINPGNSGGPLVNMQGEVIGINTLIFSETGTSAGVGFAIPSNLAGKVYSQLVKNGRVTRAYLGVMLQPVTAPLAKSVGYDGSEGAFVDHLAQGDSPAARAGLRSGDVIVEFEGRQVKSPKQLTEVIADTPVGKTAQLKYVRDGRIQSTSVSLGERPPKDAALAQNEGSEESRQNTGRLGLSVSNLTPDGTRGMRSRTQGGVVVNGVVPGSPAAEAGIEPGDVIHRVNRQPVTNRQDFVSAVSSLKEEKVVLQIEREGDLSWVTVKLD
jgi:serine protease Do